MKKLLMVCLTVLLICGMAAYVYAAASAKISAAGPHNMLAASAPGNISVAAAGQPCAFCHVPHKANGPAIGAVSAGLVPLDNRSVANTMSAFCMSCHDGATNVSAVVNNTYVTAGGSITNTSYTLPSIATMGLDNGVNHPVGVSDYNNALFMTKTANISAAGINALASSRGGMTNAKVDPIQCASCHDVHNYGANTAPFLRGDNSNSGLCLACHDA